MLRSVRRRIRNKASARNSRKKKQDYMEALEQRVKFCTDEKRQLEKKVTALEKQNSSLIGQLKRLQKLVTDGTRQNARTGTCAMVRHYHVFSHCQPAPHCPTLISLAVCRSWHCHSPSCCCPTTNHSRVTAQSRTVWPRRQAEGCPGISYLNQTNSPPPQKTIPR